MSRKEKVMSCCDIERKIRYDDTRFRSINVSASNLPFLEAIARNPRVEGSKLFKNNGTYVPDPYVFRVRCMGKLHKIIIWPDGAVTLTAHLGKVCKQRDEVYSWAGSSISCREVLDNWMLKCGGNYRHGYLPTHTKKLAEDVRTWRVCRRHNKGNLWVSERIRASIDPKDMDWAAGPEDKLPELRRRLRTRSDKLIKDTCKEVFNEDWYWRQGVSDRNGIEKFRNGLHYNYSICLSLDFDQWKTKLGKLGLLKSNLTVLSPRPWLVGGEGGKLISTRVLPVRVLDYAPYTKLVEEGNILLEALDSSGHLYLVEVSLASKLGKRKQWRVIDSWPSDERLVQIK